MAIKISQERMDQAVDVLRRKPCTNQELADALSVTYQYASMIMALLKRNKIVKIDSTVGRQNRYTLNDQLFTIPGIGSNNANYVETIKAWLKKECVGNPSVNRMFNSHFMWSLLNILVCIRTYNRQQHESSRRQLLQYREALTGQIELVDALLANSTLWDKEMLGKLINDPDCPTTDEVNAWFNFAKAKLGG